LCPRRWRPSGLSGPCQPCQHLAADDGKVVKNPNAKGDDGSDIEIDAEPVAQKCQQASQENVGKEAAQKDTGVKLAVQFGSRRSKQ
jgi:hypothetical protein